MLVYEWTNHMISWGCRKQGTETALLRKRTDTLPLVSVKGATGWFQESSEIWRMIKSQESVPHTLLTHSTVSWIPLVHWRREHTSDLCIPITEEISLSLGSLPTVPLLLEFHAKKALRWDAFSKCLLLPQTFSQLLFFVALPHCQKGDKRTHLLLQPLLPTWVCDRGNTIQLSKVFWTNKTLRRRRAGHLGESKGRGRDRTYSAKG